MAEDKPDFDENDKKIIQLYQVISELIDEQNSRAKDMAILHSGTDEEAEELMDRIEARNDAVLKQMYADLELKDKEEEEEDDEEGKARKNCAFCQNSPILSCLHTQTNLMKHGRFTILSLRISTNTWKE